MGEHKAIEHLVEYPISRREMDQLSVDQQAAIAILSYAVSETNALSRIYLSASHEMIDDTVIDYASAIQRFVVLRAWSARLFEAEKFLQLGGKKKKSQDEDLLKLAEWALEQFEELKSSEGYDVADDIRNNGSNHYSFTAARRNLKHVAQHANCSLYLHEMNGNSFYPFGEEVVFSGMLNRRKASSSDKSAISELLGNWMEWNVEANGWLASTHVRFVKELLFDKQAGKAGRKKSFWIPPSFVGTHTKNKVPLFLRHAE